MATFSFDFELASQEAVPVAEFVPSTVSFHSDAGAATRFEGQIVMKNTARAMVELIDSPSPLSLIFDIKVEADELEQLRSDHYTLHVRRDDGMPMQKSEVQFAIMMETISRRNEPVFSVPRSALRKLLWADKEAGRAFYNSLADAQYSQRTVWIEDKAIADRLVQIDLIVPSKVVGEYILVDIAVG